VSLAVIAPPRGMLTLAHWFSLTVTVEIELVVPATDGGVPGEVQLYEVYTEIAADAMGTTGLLLLPPLTANSFGRATAVTVQKAVSATAIFWEGRHQR